MGGLRHAIRGLHQPQSRIARVLDELPYKDERQTIVSILFKHFVKINWYILAGRSLAKAQRVSLHLALGFLQLALGRVILACQNGEGFAS